MAGLRQFSYTTQERRLIARPKQVTTTAQPSSHRHRMRRRLRVNTAIWVVVFLLTIWMLLAGDNLSCDALPGLVFVVVAFVRHRVRQFRLLDESLESLLAFPNAVLFLRSFVKDQQFVWRSFVPEWMYAGSFDEKGSRTTEDLIVKSLRKFLGPVVGLGDPRDRMPRLGLHRLYCTDAEWQSAVRALSAHARLIIILSSASSGLDWELDHVRNHVPPGKLFVLTSPRVVFWRVSIGWKTQVREEWREVVTRFRQSGMTLPDEYPGDGSVIAFKTFAESYVLSARRSPRATALAIRRAIA